MNKNTLQKVTTQELSHYEASTPLSYDALEDIHRPDSQDFRESPVSTLREFFAERSDSQEKIDMTIQFVKTIREHMEEKPGDRLSFGHDNEGTIAAIYTTPSQEQDQQSLNLVEIVRFNPLNATGMQDIDVYSHVNLHYSPTGNKASANIETITGDIITYDLDGTGGASQVTRTSLTGEKETSLIYPVDHLDSQLEYDHPSPEEKQKRERQKLAASAIAFYGL